MRWPDGKLFFYAQMHHQVQEGVGFAAFPACNPCLEIAEDFQQPVVLGMFCDQLRHQVFQRVSSAPSRRLRQLSNQKIGAYPGWG